MQDNRIPGLLHVIADGFNSCDWAWLMIVWKGAFNLNKDAKGVCY